ncbi:MAG: RNA-binding protein [Nitrososphaerota archaeon]
MSTLSEPKQLVIVGKKPLFKYVTACITLFNRGSTEIALIARGRCIPICIDTVHLLRRAFKRDVLVKDISIWSEQYESYGRKRYISYIRILISQT